MGRKKQEKSTVSKEKMLLCPSCLSDELDMISPRMKKCESCGFIWNHEVSDRDNLLLIVEHQAKRETRDAELVGAAPLQITSTKAQSRKSG